MDNYIIPGALFFVMILLLLVVYDSNTTMQKTVGKIRRQRPKEMTTSRQEVVTMEAQQVTATGEYLASSAQAQPQSAIAVQQMQILENQPVVAMENREQLIMPSDNIIQPQEKPGNIMEWYVGYFRRLLRKGNQEKPAMQAVHIQQQDTMTSTISELQSALADLTGRISQTESNLDKFGQLEEGITKVTEETEMVSEEMKDILGSIRVSIDRLENRVNQVSTELQEVRDAEAQSRGIEGGDTIDEETKNQIKRLEELVADISESMGALKSLPEDVTGAVNNSRHALNNTQEVGERLEVIWDNLQSTLGYGARKTFKCDSCGSHGYVASQVTCSRCGISGWYGWYPTDQDLPAAMLGSNSTDPDELPETVEPDDIYKTDALSDINGMAEMFGIADVTAEGTEVKHDTGRDKIPEISELEEMMQSAGVKDILDVPRLSEDTEETETGDSIQVTEDSNSDDAVTEPDNKSKPQKKKRAKKPDNK